MISGPMVQNTFSPKKIFIGRNSAEKKKFRPTKIFFDREKKISADKIFFRSGGGGKKFIFLFIYYRVYIRVCCIIYNLKYAILSALFEYNIKNLINLF